jgi:hypothetical protein
VFKVGSASSCHPLLPPLRSPRLSLESRSLALCALFWSDWLVRRIAPHASCKLVPFGEGDRVSQEVARPQFRGRLSHWSSLAPRQPSTLMVCPRLAFRPRLKCPLTYFPSPESCTAPPSVLATAPEVCRPICRSLSLFGAELATRPVVRIRCCEDKFSLRAACIHAWRCRARFCVSHVHTWRPFSGAFRRLPCELGTWTRTLVKAGTRQVGYCLGCARVST